MHYYQHHIGDFIRDTSRLSNEHLAAYLRMLWMYYESEQPLPNNPKVLALKVGSDVEVVAILLEAYFSLDGDVWRHSRCDREIAEYHGICERNQQNGKKGGRPKKTQKKPKENPVGFQSVPNGIPGGSQSEPSGNPDITLTSNHKPVTNNPPISPKGESLSLPVWVSQEAWDGFDEMRTRIKKPMTAKAKSLILSALSRMHERGIDPNEVLDASTRNCWQDVYEPKVQSGRGNPAYGNGVAL